MSITLQVGLVSGRTVQIETGLNVEVRVFNRRARRALSVGKGRLVHSNGSVLDEAKTIEDCELRNEDFLNLQIQPIAICATRPYVSVTAAFAGVLGNGSVVTWGRVDLGGNGSAVQDKLKNVQQIQASVRAFAAILADRAVMTWGDAAFGGDSSAVQDELKNVQQIQANFGAFAAILADGAVVTWGDAHFGGDSVRCKIS